MHRIKTWARTKAHGPAPLVAESRRTNTGSSRTGQHALNTTPSHDGVTPAPAGDAATAATATAATTDGPKLSEKRQQRAHMNVMVRFFLVIKDILFSSIINVLLVFVPVGIAVKVVGLSGGIIFAMNAIAIIPLAGLLSHATESVAKRLGDTVGALMNVTFGNAVELIIFIIALVKNEIRIVQASLLGSILANLLLILGMCFLFGGLRFREQLYNSTVTQMSACLLSLSVISLLLPTAFHASFSDNDTADDKVLKVSRGTSIILLLVYGLYLLFQLNSHAYMYESTPQHIIERETIPGPAAQLFDSSSSSDSSDSSSDSDSSGKSISTAKKIKRAMKGKRHRKPSTVSNDEGSRSAGLPSPRVAESAGLSVDATDFMHSPVDSIAVADGEVDEAPKMSKHHKKRKDRKERKERKQKHRAIAEEGSSANGHASSSAPAAAAAHPMDDSKRVDFALAPNIESQTDTRPKPFSLRSIRPTIPKTISQNVFTTRPQNLATLGAISETTTRSQFDLRRTTSMPNDQRTFRTQPGSIPPIVPVVVNSTPKTHHADEEDDEPEISKTTAVLLLLISTGLVALCAEFMVDAIQEVVGDGDSSGVSEAFIGLILLPIVGNAAEHVTAVTVAMKNKMDLAIGVAVGSSIQIAIFVTPLVVVLGWCMGKDMSLFFTLFETISLFVSTFIVNFLVLDGRSNYLEGALLCSAYIIIAIAAFFYPNAKDASSLGGGDDASAAVAHATRSIAQAFRR